LLAWVGCRCETVPWEVSRGFSGRAGGLYLGVLRADVRGLGGLNRVHRASGLGLSRFRPWFWVSLSFVFEDLLSGPLG